MITFGTIAITALAFYFYFRFSTSEADKNFQADKFEMEKRDMRREYVKQKKMDEFEKRRTEVQNIFRKSKKIVDNIIKYEENGYNKMIEVEYYRTEFGFSNNGTLDDYSGIYETKLNLPVEEITDTGENYLDVWVTIRESSNNNQLMIRFFYLGNASLVMRIDLNSKNINMSEIIKEYEYVKNSEYLPFTECSIDIIKPPLLKRRDNLIFYGAID